MKTVTSRTNPAIKQMAALQHKKYRTQYGEFIAQGIRSCSALIAAGHMPTGLYIVESILPEAQKLVSEKLITLVPDHVMQKISSTTEPSGMVGQFAIPPAPKPENLTQGLVLAQVADPGNMGTLIRTAAALNTKSVVIVEGVDPWSPKVVQASAGTIGMVTIFQWSWDQLLAQKGNKKLRSLIVSGGQPPSKQAFENTLLVVGSEAHGIPLEWINSCESTMTLPMPGNAESLNAAVAGSIALYLATQTDV